MCPKTAPEKTEVDRSKLLGLIAKYLNFIDFIKTASSHTQRAYALDLSQAFHFEKEAFTALKNEHQGLVGRLSEAEQSALLNDCRKAQSSWMGLSAASRNRKAATLKSFLRWLHEEELIGRDLGALIHSPSRPRRLPHAISVDEAHVLIQTLRETCARAGALDPQKSADAQIAAQRAFALVLLLYGAGLRVSEACQLRWQQFENGGKILRIVGKGNKERLAALPDGLFAQIEVLKTESSEWVFGDSPMGTRQAYEIVRAAGVNAGLMRPLHPHALRHSFATHMLASGANLRTLQELLGHSSLQATERYTHLNLDQLAMTMESFHPFGDKPRKPA